MSRLSLRHRLGLLSALAVALTVVLASALVYALVRGQLRGNVDDDLRSQARSAQVGPAAAPGTFEAAVPPGAPPPGGQGQGAGASGSVQRPRGQEGDDTVALPPPRPGGPVPFTQLLSPAGAAVARPPGEPALPIPSSARELAINGGDPRLDTVEVDGDTLRVLTEPLPEGGAVQLASSLEGTEETLHTLLLILALVSAGGVALAAALGPVVARTALAPAAEVSGAAEEVARTRDLTRRIGVRGNDELGRLASSFNQMMEALERSEASQRRLVADASHELRTPLATLRTNIEILGRTPDLEAAERNRLVEDLTTELAEMTDLVSDVVELAREPGRLDGPALQDVRLDELTADAVERARRRARGLSFREDLSPSVVRADPQRLGRAISNLLDNACKWSPPGGDIEVDVSGGCVSVRDHGPGFGDADLSLVFDRFWRSDEARGTPGSGLGLAIVQRVAEEHGGTARAADADGGGAEVSLELPDVSS
jgi:two-component system sensor histidine kinase MprB